MNHSTVLIVLGIVALAAFVATVYENWPNIRCMFGKHGYPLVYGGVHIDKIDYENHAITYANKRNCPNCGKTVELDWSQ